MSTSIEHRRQQQCRGDRTGVAAALAALDDHRVGAPAGHLLGVLGQADRRNHHHACFFELRDQVGFGRQRKRRDLDALADQQVDALVRVTGVGPDVDAERLVGGGLHLRDRGRKFVERHGRRCEDAETAGVRGRRHQPRTRHPAHPGLHHRMLDADQFGQRGAEASHRIFLVPQRLRIDDLADQLLLVLGGQPRRIGGSPGRAPRTRCSRRPARPRRRDAATARASDGRVR